MENGAPLNYQDKKDEWTPLIYAIYWWNWRMAKVLIRAGANVNLADSANRTPLMWAAIRNSGITATVLVEYGADINAVDVSGRTALQYAIIYTNYTLAAYLAEAGKKPSAQRLQKEQFDRLENKRRSAKFEAESMKLFGKKNKQAVRVILQDEKINKNVKIPKSDPIQKAKVVKKAILSQTKTVAAAPKPEKKPVTIMDILNAEKPATPTPAKVVPAKVAPAKVAPVKPLPTKLTPTIIPAENQPARYNPPKYTPKNTTTKVQPTRYTREKSSSANTTSRNLYILKNKRTNQAPTNKIPGRTPLKAAPFRSDPNKLFR